MIADRVRVEAYAQALRKTVKPGSVVLDIGTGPGIFAVLACKLGARRVYAIEADEIIQVGREIATANGCADLIVFIEEISTAVDLPEKADVIVSDLHGVLPLFEGHIPSIMDARARFLAPGGVLVPRKETIWAAIVDASETYRGIVDPWENNCLGQDLSPARRLVVNEFVKRRVEPSQMLARTATIGGSGLSNHREPRRPTRIAMDGRASWYRTWNHRLVRHGTHRRCWLLKRTRRFRKNLWVVLFPMAQVCSAKH